MLREHFRFIDASGEGRPGKIYRILCGTWLSSKGAVLKDHVLGKNKKNSDGKWERQPGSHARKAALQPPPSCVEAPVQLNSNIIVNVPRSEPVGTECSPPPPPSRQRSRQAAACRSRRIFSKGLHMLARDNGIPMDLMDCSTKNKYIFCVVRQNSCVRALGAWCRCTSA